MDRGLVQPASTALGTRVSLANQLRESSPAICGIRERVKLLRRPETTNCPLNRVNSTGFVWIGKEANQVGESGEADPIWSAVEEFL